MKADAGIVANSQILESWFNGLYTALVLFTIWTIFTCNGKIAARKYPWTAIVLAMYLSSTIHCSFNWNQLVLAAKRGGDTGFSTVLLHPTSKIETAGSVFFAANIVMADLILAWRCWIVWQRRWYFALVPACGSIAGIVLAALAIHSEVVLQETNVAVNVIQEHSKLFVSLSNGFFGLSIATSLTATILISLRIFIAQKEFREAGLILTSAYSSVIEIIVESAVLYSTTLLLFVIFESVHTGILYFPQEIHAQVSGIAPTLIILRVASGNSRPESHWDQKQSKLQFAGANSSETTTSSRSVSDSDGQLNA